LSSAAEKSGCTTTTDEVQGFVWRSACDAFGR
jgi:hypothetical protein